MYILDMVWILCIYQAGPGVSQKVDCASGPCQNEALCQDTESGFQCFCVDGYAGELCEINFDDCSSTPCRNNATCIDHVASYACACADGFTGQDCQLNIDECLSSPCLSNSTCIDLVNGFVCECTPPFRGENCALLPCDTGPCENEAVCRNDIGFNESLSGFVCDCITGFSGPRCELNLEDCDLVNFTSCSGNGLCVDGINDYSCLCEPGWVGEYCQSPVDDCIGNSCKNNATCTDLHLGYLCTCKPGYEGALCEREKDECSAWQPCKNGAICEDMFNEYKCKCADGWSGVNCTEEVNECDTNECQNGAQCLDVIAGFQCRCPPFYTGLLCETQYNPCTLEYNPCQNEANCIIPPDGVYRCFCAAGFTGVHCEVNVDECQSLPCENNVTCEDVTAGYICHCTLGWEGQNCQNNVDDCASEPCLNDADCIDLHNRYECNCTRDYQGPICDEAVDYCLKNPCFHDSTCLSFVGGYTCLCSPPYTGAQCLELIDTCQSNPCVNNGTCMNTVTGFICSCPLPFTGKTCNERVDFCESEPCFLGTCVSLDNDFVCACPEYITGKQCTDLVDYCGDSPCQNEGNCINGEFDFRCVCAYGFTGRRCIEMIDFCVEEPCQNDANCTNIPGGFKCICQIGFTGDLCQDILPTVISSSSIYTSSSLIYISSKESASSISTMFLLPSASSMFDILTITSTTSKSPSADVTPSSVIQSDASSMLESLPVSTSLVYRSFSKTIISFSSSLELSSVTKATNIFKTSEASTIYINPSFSGTVKDDEIGKTSTIHTTSIDKSIYIPTTEKTDYMYSSGTTSLSISSYSTYAFVMFTKTADLSSNYISNFVSKTVPYLTTYTIPSDYSSSVLVPSTEISISQTRDMTTSKGSYPGSLLSSVTSISVTGVLFSHSTNSLSNFVASTIMSSHSSDTPTYSTHLRSSLTDSTTFSASSISYVLDSYSVSFTTVPIITFTASQYLPSSIGYFSSISSSFVSRDTPISSYNIKGSVTSSTPFKTTLTTATLMTARITETSLNVYSYKSLVKSSVSAVESSFSFMYSSPSSFDDRASSSSSDFESSSVGVSFNSAFSSETQTGTNTYITRKESDKLTKPSTVMLSTSLFPTAGIRSSSSHSSQDTDTFITNFTPKATSTNVMSKTTSDLETSFIKTDSSFLHSLSHPTLSAFGSSTVKASEKYSKASSLSQLPSMTMSTGLTTENASFSSDHSSITTFESEFTSYLTTSFTDSVVTSFMTGISFQPTSSSSYKSTIGKSTTNDSSETPDISSTLSHSVDMNSSPASPSSVPFSFSGAISQTDPSFYISSVVPDGSTDTTNMFFATKSLTPTSFYKAFSGETLSAKSSFTLASTTSTIYQISPTSSKQHLSSKPLSVSDSTAFQKTIPMSSLNIRVTKTVLSSEEIQTTYTISSNEAVRSSSIVSRSDGIRPTNIQTTSKTINPTKPFSSKDVESKTSLTSTVTALPTDADVSFKTIISTDSSSTLVESTPTTSFFSVTTSSVLRTTPSLSTTTSSVSTTVPSVLKTTSYRVTTTSPIPTSTSIVSTATSSVPTTSLFISTTTTAPSTSCDTYICYNGGLCREDVSGTFCDCRDRYLGPQCETESTACEGFVCENGGFCVVTLTVFGVQVPRCNCLLPFVGSTCESEKLIYYPTFIGSSYLEFRTADISPDQSNEIYISVKTTQRDATILYSANQDVDYKQAAFISLYLTNGKFRYSFSCDGVMAGNVETDLIVNTEDVYEIVIRQVWSAGPGEWCSAAMMINSRAFVSAPLLSVKQSQVLGKLYIGGIPRFTYQDNTVPNTHVMDGYIGCIHNFQVNKKEINLVSMATEGINIDNCNVPVCQYNPCKNGATCHSSGEDWFCSCLPGYGGSLCERKLCGVNPCQHGGTCIIVEEEHDQLCLCAYGRAGAFCEKAISVSLTQFVGDQYGYGSYIAYDHPHYLENDFKMEFSMILDNGSSDNSVIMFLGNTGSYDGRRDFMAVGIEQGYVVLRFDLGSGYGQLYSAEELDTSLHQHVIKFGRDQYRGWIQTDNQRNVSGRSPGVLTALNTNSKLYVGNIEFSEIGILPLGADFDNGFKGCIFNLKIRSHITDFTAPGRPPGHVVNGRNIGQCSSMSCDQNPCQNGAECRDLGASIYCICVEGWKGTFCTDVITVCDVAHACMSGSTCVPVISEGYTCLCSLGRKGAYCEQELNISDPLFLGEGSYMSFEPVYIKKKIDLQIQMRTNASEGLLFYVAQRLHSHAGDFLSLTLNNRMVEMRIDMGSSVNIIRHEVELHMDRWYTIEAGRNISHGYISVDGDTVSAQLTGMLTFLDTTTDFYIGGLPSLADASPDGFENEPEAFRGCIRELVVNNKLFQLDKYGARDGRGIDDCDGTSCGYGVCKNGGSCTTTDNDTFNCSCTPSYVGTTCDIPIVCENHECLNGKCRATDEDSYVCDCFLVWSGQFCDDAIVLETSVELTTESFIHFSDENFLESNKSSTNISFVFKSTKLTGLVLWNGQTYSDDEDYLGVGLQDGRVKLVWNLGWYSRGEIITSIKFNDGDWHTVVIKREKQILTLDVDGITYESRVSGDFFNLDTFGEYFIGSFKEGRVRDKTLGYFTEPFSGCLKDLLVNKYSYVEFDTVDDGINILSCAAD